MTIGEDLRFEIEEELNRQVLLGAGDNDDLTGLIDESSNTVAYVHTTPTHDNIMDALLDA